MTIDLLYALLVGLLAGLHAATWGCYKDSPHEGFELGKYLRSVGIGLLSAGGIYAVLGLDASTAAGAVILFGSVYIVERAVTEIYKTFFRQQAQEKYTIPMQFAILGRPVTHRGTRALAGLGYGAVMLTAMAGVLAYQRTLGSAAPRLIEVVLFGAIGGWISAFGGAWKDAPIEGFQLRKFFRSPVVAMAFAALLSLLSHNLVPIALAATGYTVASIETYKTFLASGPPGKFADKPIRFPEMIRRRVALVPLYTGIWLAVLAAAGVAFSVAGD